LKVFLHLIALSSPYPFLESLESLEALHLDLVALQGAAKLKKLRPGKLSYANESDWRILEPLTELVIYGDYVALDSLALEFLPPRLTILNCWTIGSFPSRCLPRTLQILQIWGEDMIVGDEFLADLPPHVRDLKLIAEKGNASVSNQGIALLPRTLEVLSLSPAFELTDEAISHLPTSLIRLSLHSGVNRELQLTYACAPFFPRRLTFLLLKNSPHLTNDALKHLPRTLTTYEVDRLWQIAASDAPPLALERSLDLSENDYLAHHHRI
jgi:hypothetical protein